MRFKSLGQWLAWQETLHPTGMDLGLERCREVRRALQWGDLPFPVITVAGTNGKGSTVAFLESLFRAGGYRTGTYTSPHLLRYNERIRVAAEEASDETLMAAFQRIEDVRGETTVTYFEYGTFAAIDTFLNERVDVAILEVGIGGRLDAVNVFDPDVAVVTPIAIDHVKWLGSDRESAGREKAGIFRAGKPAVVADPMPPRSVAAASEEVGAVPYQLNRQFRVQCQPEHWEWHGPGRSILPIAYPALIGAFQTANAAGAVMAAVCLADRLPLEDSQVVNGVANVELRGRFERLAGVPTRILDIAHNPHAAQALARSLTLSPCHGATHAVVGMLNDKDHASVLRPLVEVVDHWYVAGLAGVRGTSAAVLAQVLRTMTSPAVIEVFETVGEARQAAIAACRSSDRVLIFGSCHTVGEALASEAPAAAVAYSS